jgi:4-amino-4-deoxy-L-arabinose transferase-like glycosyltransferase
MSRDAESLSPPRPATGTAESASPSSAGRASFLVMLRWRWIWLACMPVVLVQLNWLINESASPFGDEPAHMNMAYGLAQAWQSGQNFWDSFARAYQGGNGRYPPLAYALMLAVMHLGANPLVAARVVSAVVTSCAVLIFSAATVRATGRVRNGLICTILLLGSPLVIQAERFVLLEGYLLLLMAMLLYAFVAYIQTARFAWWLFAAVIVGLGMLTKFNFLMYTGVLLGMVAIREVLRWRRKQTRLPAVLGRFAAAGLIVAAMAGPWYWQNATAPDNAGSGLKGLIDMGHLEVARTPRDIAAMVSRAVANVFPLVQTGAALLIFACWAAWALRRRPGMSSAEWLVLAGIGTAVVLGVLLSVIGLGREVRWHLQYVLLVPAVVIMLDSIAWRPVRRAGGGHAEVQERAVQVRAAGWVLAGALLVGPLVHLGVTNGPIRFHDTARWLRTPLAGFFGAPDPRPTGNVELAGFIDRTFPVREDGTPVRIAFMVHDHRGFHSQTVGWELERLGRDDVVLDRVGFFDRPIDIDQFLGSDLIVTARFEQLTNDRESMRYQPLEDALPGLIGPSFAVERMLQTRFFEASLLRPAGWAIDCDMVARVLAAARAQDPRPEASAYYDLLALIWNCRLGCPFAGDPGEVQAAAEAYRASSLSQTQMAVQDAMRRLEECRRSRRSPKGQE